MKNDFDLFKNNDLITKRIEYYELSKKIFSYFLFKYLSNKILYYIFVQATK